MGTLIILEGGDGSGKATQTKVLQERLIKEGYAVKTVTFPNYDSQSSALVKMYLAGEFGTKPEDVNPFVASAFYAVDRFASFRTEWETFYRDGGIILADRYTTSNMVHQMVKYESPVERANFLDWLTDFEFNKFGLPVPDLVCLLDVPMSITEKLMAHRTHKTGGATGDIHEQNREYLYRCHSAYEELIQRFAWQRIDCAKQNGEMRTIEDIHEDVYLAVQSILQSS